MMPAEMLEQAAGRLAQAERSAEPIEALSDVYPDLSVADAYQIQRLQIAQKLAAGRVVKGHKVGLTSRAMQQMLNVSEPDFGHLLDDMFVADGGHVSVDGLCSPRAEFEVAFVLGSTLPAPGCTVADVIRATAFLLPSIEVIDSRQRDWKITLVDTVADNASSARVVLGAQATSLADVDLATMGAVARRNGEIVATGSAGAVLGHPANAVAWLANKLHEVDVELSEGHVVLPGSCTAAVEVTAGDALSCEFDGLGRVAVAFQ